MSPSSKVMTMDWKNLKIRLQQKSGNYATTPEEAVVSEASRIIRRREQGRRRIFIWTLAWEVITFMYWCVGISDYINYDSIGMLVASVFVTGFGIFYSWYVRAGVREADDPQYDWALKYRFEVMQWRIQREAEGKNCEPMKKYPPE